MGFSVKILAQELLFIDSILASGNDRTKLSYIEKLLPFSVGDSMEKTKLATKLNTAKSNLINSKLFNSVRIESLVTDSSKLKLLIYVEERWYLYPVPFVGIADRNFNEWWVDRNRELNRLLIGGDVVQKNLTGHNDDLRFSVFAGFEQKVNVRYSIPFLSKSKKWGFATGIGWARNKNVAVTTENNKLVFWKSSAFLRRSLHADLSISFQPQFLKVHELNVRYGSFQIHDSLASYHPNYLLNARDRLNLIQVSYNYLLDRRDYRGYPSYGYLIGTTIQQTFFANLSPITSALLRFNKHHSIKQFTFSTQSIIYTSWGNNQPYVLQRGFGWENNLVRGYNYYVIEGEHYFIQKLSLAHKLGIISIKTPFLPSQIRELNTTLYPKLFVDAGYVSSSQFMENGTLDNRLLLGAGIGLDLLSYYDSVWRLEYAINNQWESGFFLNFTLFIQ